MTTADSNNSEAMRTVFYVSNRTGLTAEHYGRSLLTQFPEQEYECVTLSFVDNLQKAMVASHRITMAYQKSGKKPIVFSTIIDESQHQLIDNCEATIINVFNTFLEPLEQAFGELSAHRQGKSRGNRRVKGNINYQRRLDAIDYSLSHDDGVRYDQYDEADVILVGVSRSGKTPTSLYLAMNFSLKVSNYPLKEEDLTSERLPDFLLKHKHKLVALTIKVVPLSKIRRARRPNSEYASLKVCEREIRISEAMFKHAEIPVFESTDTSIEEIASKVVQSIGIGLTESAL